MVTGTLIATFAETRMSDSVFLQALMLCVRHGRLPRLPAVPSPANLPGRMERVITPH